MRNWNVPSSWSAWAVSWRPTCRFQWKIRHRMRIFVKQHWDLINAQSDGRNPCRWVQAFLTQMVQFQWKLTELRRANQVARRANPKMGAKAKTKERANTKARRLVRKAIKLAKAMETIFSQVHGKIDRILHNRLDGVASLTAQARVQSLARVPKEKAVARTMIRHVIVAGSLDILLGIVVCVW